MFYGSALTNFGVRTAARRHRRAWHLHLPLAWTRDSDPRGVDAAFSAVVFKVQSNMDPAHRDRMAFLRVCSGRFERGMGVACGRTGKTLATKYAHTVVGRDRSTAEQAWPGDVIGLVNAAELRVGDAVHAVGEQVAWPEVPSFAPSSFRTGPLHRHLQDQAVPLRDPPARLRGRGAGAATAPQRREHADPGGGGAAAVRRGRAPAAPRVRSPRRAGAAAPWTTARRTDAASAGLLGNMSGVTIVERADGAELLALFESPYWLARLQADHPELTLQRLIGEG